MGSEDVVSLLLKETNLDYSTMARWCCWKRDQLHSNGRGDMLKRSRCGFGEVNAKHLERFTSSALVPPSRRLC